MGYNWREFAYRGAGWDAQRVPACQKTAGQRPQGRDSMGLRVENVSKSFGEKKAVDNLSFAV